MFPAPYTDLHALNLDWILQIVKDFKEKYPDLDEYIQTALDNIIAAGESGVGDIQTALTNAQAAIASTLAAAESDIDTSRLNALGDIGTASAQALETISEAETDARATISRDLSSAEADISAAKSTALTDIGTAKSSALTDISDSRTAALSDLASALSDAQTAITAQRDRSVMNILSEGTVQEQTLQRIADSFPLNDADLLGQFTINNQILLGTPPTWVQGIYTATDPDGLPVVQPYLNSSTRYVSSFFCAGCHDRTLSIQTSGCLIAAIIYWTGDFSQETGVIHTSAQIAATSHTVTFPSDANYFSVVLEKDVNGQTDLLLSSITAQSCVFTWQSVIQDAELEAGIWKHAVANALNNANALDAIALCGKTNDTDHNVTFTWQSDGSCQVSTTGTASSPRATNVIFDSATGFPPGMQAGGSYRLKYSSSNVYVRIFVYADGALITQALIAVKTNRDFTIPATAEGLKIDIAVSANTAANETIKPVIMGDTLSNAELMACALVNKGILDDGTDLDNIKETGLYMINSGRNYSHSPWPSTYGGVLLVYAYNDNFCVQIASKAKTGEMFQRSNNAVSATGEWPAAWGSNGVTTNINYINEYVSQDYSNTYNITCTPTITADTNQYLASTGDDTDRTGDIQTMLNTTGICRLGPGKFIVSGITIPDYGELIGSGPRSLIRLNEELTEGYCIQLKNQGRVSNMRISGSSTTITVSDPYNTESPLRHGIIFEGTRQSGSTAGTTYKRSMIDHCIISGFTGGGITCNRTGTPFDSNMLISDCFVYNCGAGFYVPYYSEFHRIVNCAFTSNFYGTLNNGGNNNFSNCDFSGNRVGICIDNNRNQSTNNSHGTFTGCSVNHSYSEAGVINEGVAIKLLKSNLGEIFDGAQIFYGAIILDDCVGVRFIGANIGSKVPMTITDSVACAFTDCNFKEAADSETSPVTITNSDTLKFRDCMLRDGTEYDPTIPPT